MCRFVIYQGPPIVLADLVTRPAHSLIHQSFKAAEREEPLNGDGFGLGWYAPGHADAPALFKDVSPAWNNENLKHLARVTRAGTVLAHVRAATRGIVVRTNCHPFAHGQLAFMHNGDMGGFSTVRRALLAGLSDEAFGLIRGNTDSEHMFAVFVDALAARRAAAPEVQTVLHMAGALDDTIARVAELTASTGRPCTLNLVATDGVHTVASRCLLGEGVPPNTLYLRRGARYACEGGVCSMSPPAAEARAVLIASEPLFDHETWEPVPLGHVVCVDADRAVTLRPLSAAAAGA